MIVRKRNIGLNPIIENEITTLDEFYEIEWVKDCMDWGKFYKMCYSGPDYVGDVQRIMTTSHYDEKYGGCKGYFVVGFVDNGDISTLGLPCFDDLVGKHKSDCEYITIPRGGHGSPCTCGFK